MSTTDSPATHSGTTSPPPAVSMTAKGPGASTPPPSSAMTTANNNNTNGLVHHGIAVACRVRPMSAQEALNPKSHIGVRCLEDSIILEAPASKNLGGVGYSRSSTPKDRQYHLDHVFHSHATQDEVYRTTCQHVVKGLFDGINGSILAYGATGAGKTYTMFGSGLSAGGVIYQAVQDIFDEKDRLEHTVGRFVAITCTFLEVYNEEVFDLLAKKRSPLAIREDEGNQLSRGGGTVNVEALSIKGLTRAAPKDIVEFDGIIELGRKNRFTATTNANEQSSRSHAIISVEVEVRENESSSAGTIARIRLCDLAGSERAAATTNRGLRIREGGNINKSLLALGTVVQALAKRSKLPPNKASEVFVPYRGSKLTRLLRDCLGGNCNTSMLFCVTPSILGFEESCNTMLFAMQAKLVQVAAKRNEFTVNVAEVARNQENIIERLRLELAVVKEELVRVSAESGRVVDFTALMMAAWGGGVQAIEGGPNGSGSNNQHQDNNTHNNNAIANGSSSNTAANGGSLVSRKGPDGSPLDGVSGGSYTTIAGLNDTGADGESDAAGGLPCYQPIHDGALNGTYNDSLVVSPQRVRSQSISNTPMMSPKVVTLVDGGSLILDGPFLPNANGCGMAGSLNSGPTASAGGANAGGLNSSTFASAAGTPRAPTPTHGGASSLSMARARTVTAPSPAQDHAHHSMAMWAELQQRLKDITDEKTNLHRELQANMDKQASLELLMRKERLSLCELMATMPRGELPNPPPIRVVGQLQAISQTQSKLTDLRSEYNQLNAKADHITSRVNMIGKETIRERTVNPVVELLIENASLKFALLDAEAFASEYNSKLSQAESKYVEATDALHRCQEVLREMLQIADARDKERERDYDRAALLAANTNSSSGGSGTGGSGSGNGIAPNSSGGGSGSSASAAIMPAPPTCMGRRCAAAIALATAPDSRTDDMMEQFKKVFTKCYAKLTSRGALLGADGSSGADGLSNLSDTPNKPRTGGMKKIVGVGGGFSRSVTQMPSSSGGSMNSPSSAGGSSGGGAGGGNTSTPPSNALGGTSSGGVSPSAGLTSGGSFSRLSSANPNSMLSSQMMRDLRKKAGLVGGATTGNLTNRSSVNLSSTVGGKSSTTTTTTTHQDVSDDALAGSWNAAQAQSQMRNTSPYGGSGGAANGSVSSANGGAGSNSVGFTVSRANGRPQDRIKAPAAANLAATVGGSPSSASAGGPFQRMATATPSSGAGGANGTGKAAPTSIIKPRA